MSRRPKPPDGTHSRAVVRLPPLGAEEALRLVDFLERCRSAIWAAHGEAMGELLLERYADRYAPPVDGDAALLRALDQDGDLPF